ncbi:hypothetical protein ACQPZG_05040 (plasmid) [Streptomyces sp. CA-294286]|uniref:hypothetical protein n=1 Tax=Streptomyces sp. CA-294286 TaxID=3240070 RepID=UPI003D9461DD
MRLRTISERHRWPAKQFPAEIADLRQRLMTSLTVRVGADGAVRDPCRSRALGSVLALRLLERTGDHPQAASALRAFLGDDTAATRAERALAVAALDRRAMAAADLFVSEVTRAAPDFTAVRKRALDHSRQDSERKPPVSPACGSSRHSRTGTELHIDDANVL